jgi:hypothetical protein
MELVQSRDVDRCGVCGDEPWIAGSSALVDRLLGDRQPGRLEGRKFFASVLDHGVLEALHRAWQGVLRDGVIPGLVREPEAEQCASARGELGWGDALALLRWEDEGGRVV